MCRANKLSATPTFPTIIVPACAQALRSEPGKLARDVPGLAAEAGAGLPVLLQVGSHTKASRGANGGPFLLLPLAEQEPRGAWTKSSLNYRWRPTIQRRLPYLGLIMRRS